MLDLLLTLVVVLIIGGLLFWAVNKLSGAFGLPPPVVAVIQVVLVIVFVLLVLGLLFPQLGLRLDR